MSVATVSSFKVVQKFADKYPLAFKSLKETQVPRSFDGALVPLRVSQIQF